MLVSAVSGFGLEQIPHFSFFWRGRAAPVDATGLCNLAVAAPCATPLDRPAPQPWPGPPYWFPIVTRAAFLGNTITTNARLSRLSATRPPWSPISAA